MDTKNFTIGVLSTTAAILLVGIFVIHSRPEPAVAAGMTTSGRDYVLTVGELNASEELLYVLDSAAQKLNVYVFDAGRRGIVRTQTIDLNDMRKAATPPTPGPGGRRP